MRKQSPSRLTLCSHCCCCCHIGSHLHSEEAINLERSLLASHLFASCVVHAPVSPTTTQQKSIVNFFFKIPKANRVSRILVRVCHSQQHFLATTVFTRLLYSIIPISHLLVNMFATKVAVAALSVLTVVSAGNSTFSIDVDSVTLATRGAYFTLLLFRLLHTSVSATRYSTNILTNTTSPFQLLGVLPRRTSVVRFAAPVRTVANL